MVHPSRRDFLKRTRQVSLASAAGLTILADPASVRGAPAGDKVLLASVGAGGRGTNLALDFAARGDVEFAYVCDPDQNRAEALAQSLTSRQGRAPKVVADFRQALDDKSVQAIVSATPDHWHALSTVWACQAGKDVYVEKPASHSCWEGQKMVEAARKYHRVVQVGTQNRSAAYNLSAKKYLEAGKLGKIHLCRVFNMKLWDNVPKQPDSPAPARLNWDLWNGPAPQANYNRALHSYWNHHWRYSGGDIANDASHQIDLARWLMGVDYPQSVYCTGGRFDSQGAAETPDTQVAVWEYPGLLMTFELTLYTPYMLKISPQIRESLDRWPYWPQCATRIEIYGSAGVMYVGRHGGGWQVYVRPKDERPIVKDQDNGKFPDPEHKENFLSCVRSRSRPNADVEHGHRSALLIHYANISYRLGGEKLRIDPQTEHVVDNAAAMQFFKRDYRPPYVIPENV